MKTFKILFVIFFLFLLISCSGTRKTAPQPAIQLQKDSIEYYDAEVEARHKDFSPLLMGSWNVNVMKRQARMEEERLTNVYLLLKEDGNFTGKGGCNNISGSYELKGTAIKFRNTVATKMTCDVLEQETAFLQLLEGTVSAFTITERELLLRDGASNVLFKATRQ